MLADATTEHVRLGIRSGSFGRHQWLTHMRIVDSAPFSFP